LSSPANAISATNLPAAAKTVHWYILTGIDVLSDPKQLAPLVVLGDSITDGRGSTDRWQQPLAG
jgi:hypothetical protein